MKPKMALGGLLLGACLLGSSQTNSPGRVVIPPRNSAGPRVIELSLTMGNITVKTHAGGDVIAETEGGSHDYSRAANGMHRIDIPPGEDIGVSEHDNVIRLQAPWRGGRGNNMVLTVPVQTSLSLKTTLGNITVDGVNGEIDATSTSGNITLTNVSGTVVASSTLGSQKVSMDRVDQSKPLAFSSVNGSIDVTFPPDLKANLSFRTGLSETWSDFDVTLNGARRSDGMHSLTQGHRSMDNRMAGTINGGGVEISFHAVNGRIMIHKKK